MNVRVDVRACVSGPTGVGGPPSDGDECANPSPPTPPTSRTLACTERAGVCVLLGVLTRVVSCQLVSVTWCDWAANGRA